VAEALVAAVDVVAGAVGAYVMTPGRLASN
jgi:hypothetical protein